MSKKIKILHLITGLHVGGAESMLHKIVSKMDRSAFENIVIVLKQNGVVGEKIAGEGIPVFALNMDKKLSLIGGVINLYFLLKRHKPDILQTWMYHADFLGLVIGRLAKVPHILWNIRCSKMNKNLSKKKTKMIVRACSLLSSRPATIITNSQRALEDHIQIGYSPEKWQIIPNGFDTNNFKPNPHAYLSLRRELKLSDETILVGLIARLDPAKDHENFFKAVQLFNQLDENVHFVLCGEGIEDNNPTLKKLVPDDRLRRRLHLLGLRTDMQRILPAIDITTLSSRRESFPNVIGEAMSCGSICVTTDVVDCKYLMGEAGFIVPPQNPQELAKAWEKAIGLSANEKTAFTLKARERIIGHFSIDSIVSLYEELYRNVQSRFCDRQHREAMIHESTL